MNRKKYERHIHGKPGAARGLVALLLTMLMALTVTGCDTFDSFKATFIDKQGEPEATVRIGVLEPLSGKDKEAGQLELTGIELAHQMFPKALGKEVELVIADNKSNMDVSQSVAKELVDKRVSCVLGSYGSDNSLICVDTFEEAQIPAIAITNTNPMVTSNNPYYFRVCLLDSFQGVSLAKYSVESLGAKTAAIFNQTNDDYAMAVSETFSRKFTAMTEDPGSVVLTCDFDTKDTRTIEDGLKKIKKAKPDVVFLPSKADQAQTVLTFAKRMGITATFLGTDQWNLPEFEEAIVKMKMNNVSFATVFDPDTDTTVMSESFLKAYRAKFGEDAVPESAVALGFDAYMIAVDALNKAGTALDGDAIRHCIAKTVAFPGSSGTITFDSNGDPIKTVVVKNITPRGAESAYTMEPEIVNLYQLSLQKQGQQAQAEAGVEGQGETGGADQAKEKQES